MSGQQQSPPSPAVADGASAFPPVGGVVTQPKGPHFDGECGTCGCPRPWRAWGVCACGFCEDVCQPDAGGAS